MVRFLFKINLQPGKMALAIITFRSICKNDVLNLQIQQFTSYFICCRISAVRSSFNTNINAAVT